MEEQAPSAVTNLLSNDSIDNTERLRQLLPRVYDELHRYEAALQSETEGR